MTKKICKIFPNFLIFCIFFSIIFENHGISFLSRSENEENSAPTQKIQKKINFSKNIHKIT